MGNKKAPVIRFKGYTEDWEQRKVFDLSEITFGGGTPQTGIEDYWQGNFPWIQSSDLKNDQLCNIIPTKFITDEAINKSATKAVPANSIAVVTRVGVGKLALIPYPYATSQDFLSLSNLKVGPWFGVYSLYVLIQKEINNIQGTSIKGMTKSDLLNKNIHIPLSLDEQTKIGNFFKQLDETIALHQDAIQRQQDLKKALLKKLFPVNRERIPTVRFATFKEEWEQRKLGDFYFFKNGLNKEKEFFGKGIPIVNFTDVFHNRGIYSHMLNGKVTLSASEIERYKIAKGDLFFTRTSEVINEIGMNSVMLDDVVDTVFSGFVLRGRSIDKDPLDNFFKKYVFSTSTFRNEMIKKSSMTTRALTSGTALREMYFYYPTETDEQRKIGNFLTSLENTIALHQQALDKLKLLKQSLLQKMFV